MSGRKNYLSMNSVYNVNNRLGQLCAGLVCGYDYMAACSCLNYLVGEIANLDWLGLVWIWYA